MSETKTLESEIADLECKRSASHHPLDRAQVADPDIAQPCNTDSHAVCPGPAEDAQPSAMSAPKGLKIDQKGMVWGPNGSLLGRVQDDGLAKLQEPEALHFDERKETSGEDRQKKGQALTLDTSQATRFKNVREHPFYKVRPDKNGRYYCPYSASEECWYRPQKLKFMFDEHLDTHLKPYRCDLGRCIDTSFSSADCLLRHEREMHNVQEHKVKPPLLYSHNCVEPAQGNTTCLSKSPFAGDADPYRVHEAPKIPSVRSFQDSEFLIHDDVLDKVKAFERGEGAHVVPSPPPASLYGTTPSLKSTDNNEPKVVNFLDTAFQPRQSVNLKSQYDHDISNSKVGKAALFREGDKNVMVSVDFLHKLESKISDLQSRVEECEGRPSSPTDSSISDSHDSEDSFSDFGHRSIRGVRDSRNFDDDIIIFEPEVKQDRRTARNVNPPSLTVAWSKSFSESPPIASYGPPPSPRPFYEGTRRFGGPTLGPSEPPIPRPLYEGTRRFGDKPLLTIIEDHCSNKLWRKRLEIASPAFHELLMEVSCHNLNLNPPARDGIYHLVEPFAQLFLNRQRLADYIKDTSEFSLAKEHAGFILSFMACEFGDISRMLENFESATPPNLVKYCDLWMLYQPGTTVYSRANGEWEAFVIDCLGGMDIRRPSPDKHHALTRLDISAWSMNFDGEIYGRVWSLHCIAPFHGVKDINALPLIPEKFLLDCNAVKESLVSRGKKFCSFQGQHCETSEVSPPKPTRVMVDHLTYQRRNGWPISVDGKSEPSGPKKRSWRDNRNHNWDMYDRAPTRQPRRYIPQRSFVRRFEQEFCHRDYKLESVDMPEDTQAEAYRRYSADRPFHVVVREFEKYNSIGSNAELDELSLMLCPQHMRGFCLQDNLWKLLDVSQLRQIAFHKEAWHHLAIEEDYKEALETMVLSHVSKVAGLRGSAGGKGLSILLNGEAGVGKTLTAESIAEHFGKPLFTVTSSDLGTAPYHFDEKFEEIFDYATEWGAILLLDEADILLQAQRDPENANLRRNDLDSSFVRFIEYYQGIVFMTTNRVNKFDGTLMPRIDITLGLPPLDKGRRAAIWQNQIQTLVDEGTINESQAADLRGAALTKWSKDEINGHQIKKAVRTARVLAETKGILLGPAHVETMLKMEREFEKHVGHMKKVRKAERKKTRDDFEDFEQVEKP